MIRFEEMNTKQRIEFYKWRLGIAERMTKWDSEESKKEAVTSLNNKIKEYESKLWRRE